MTSPLESNQAFLSKVIADYGDPSAQREWQDPRFIKYLKGIDEARYEGYVKQFLTKEKQNIIEGKQFTESLFLSDILIPSAKRMIGADAEIVKGVPVGLLPSKTINGFVACGPLGETAIILDDIVDFYFRCLFVAHYGWVTWNTEIPLCRDFSLSEYQLSITELMAYNITRDSSHLRITSKIMDRVLTIRDNIAGKDDPLLWLSFQSTEFILLHEYAHIVLGHLQKTSKHMFSFDSYRSISVYDRQKIQEFEADKKACNWLLEGSPVKGQRKTIIMSIGVLMRFIDLCETFGKILPETHPPAMERWKRIKEIPELVADLTFEIEAEIDEPYDNLLIKLKQSRIMNNDWHAS